MATTISNSGMDARDEQGHEANATNVRARGGGARRAMQRVGLALLMLALGYGGGRVHGLFEASDAARAHEAALEEQQRTAAEAETAHRAALSQALDQTALARDQRDQLTELSTLYESYRQAQRSLTALDQRNFGIARTHLRDSERLLLPLASELPELAPLLERMASTDVAVAGNLADQRRAIVTIVTSLDALLAPRAATLVSPLGANTPEIATGATGATGKTAVDATSHADPAPAADVEQPQPTTFVADEPREVQPPAGSGVAAE